VCDRSIANTRTDSDLRFFSFSSSFLAAARLADFASNGSMNSLLLKTGLSRDQLSQLARDHQYQHQHQHHTGGGAGTSSSSSGGLMSSGSLSNMMNLHPNHRQNSFDALMSLNFQSLQSIDNLANLMQTTSGGGAAGIGSGSGGNGLPETGLKNADFGAALAASAGHAGDPRDVGLGLGSGAGNGGGAGRTGTTPDRGANHHNHHNTIGAGANMGMGSAEDLSLAAVRRLASAGRMESLLKSFSSNNMRGVGGGDASTSNNNLSNFLQSLQANAGGSGGGGGGAGNLSTASLLHAGGPSAVSLANLLRQDSSTGLTALRMQDGLNQRNSSVDDFLSLMMAGDIPHQDASLLNVPLLHHQGPGGSGQQQQQQQQQGHQQGQQAQQHDPARLLAQSQMLQQMQDAITSDRSFANLAGLNSPAAASQLNLLAQAQQQQKRKLEELEAALTAQAVQQQHHQHHQQHHQQHQQQQQQQQHDQQHSSSAAASSASPPAAHSASSGGPGTGTGSDAPAAAAAASLVGSGGSGSIDAGSGFPPAKRAHLE
jgi:hypothetical protein